MFFSLINLRLSLLLIPNYNYDCFISIFYYYSFLSRTAKQVICLLSLTLRRVFSSSSFFLRRHSNKFDGEEASQKEEDGAFFYFYYLCVSSPFSSLLHHHPLCFSSVHVRVARNRRGVIGCQCQGVLS